MGRWRRIRDVQRGRRLSALETVRERCNAIEECYELLLAFAAQGMPSEQGGRGSQVRYSMERAVEALAGLADAYSTAVRDAALKPAEPYQAFLKVLERDANDSRIAFQLVLAQPSIGSQLIDNLNASIHIRALLTDLFLIDEILRPEPESASPVSTS